MVKRPTTPPKGLAAMRRDRQRDPDHVEPGPGVRRVPPRPDYPNPRKPGGQPLADPLDARQSRLGMRLHEDLRRELELLAREDGLRLSTFVEKVLIDGVNRRRGRDILDRLGRYRSA